MGSLFSRPSTPTPVAPPAPIPPPTMPDPFSPAVLEARRRALASAGQSGRSSTILTTAASRAGGTLAGGYGGQKLGAA